MYISILYIDIHTCASNEYLFMFSHCSDFIYNAWNCARIEREEKEEERREKKGSSVKKRLLFARRIPDSSVSRYSVACIAGDRSENRVEKNEKKKEHGKMDARSSSRMRVAFSFRVARGSFLRVSVFGEGKRLKEKWKKNMGGGGKGWKERRSYLSIGRMENR